MRENFAGHLRLVEVLKLENSKHQITKLKQYSNSNTK